jgi:hypothetical protein
MDKQAEIYEPVLLQSYRILQQFQNRIDQMKIESRDQVTLEGLLNQALQAIKNIDIKVTSLVTKDV